MIGRVAEFALALLCLSAIGSSSTATAQEGGRLPSHAKIGSRTIEEWRQAIDSHWGPGAETSEKLRIFDLAWDQLDRESGAFTIYNLPYLGSDWSFINAPGSGYLVDGHVYLAHTGVQPDVEVWLDRDDVAAGRDTVVEAARGWIESRWRRQPRDRRIPVPGSSSQWIRTAR